MDIKTFQGRISNADPHDIPPGAFVEQDNLTCLIPGQLTVRKGSRELTIGNRSDYDAYQGLATYFLQRGESNWFLWQRSDGTIQAGQNPS